MSELSNTTAQRRMEARQAALREATSHHAELERAAHAGRDWNHAYSLILFALFLGSLLLAIMLGTHSFGRISALRDAANDRRMALGVMVNSVRSFDATDAVGRSKGPEGDALVLTEHLDSGDYETRFYLYQGNIVEEYALAGTAPTPEKATVLAPSSSFSFEYQDGLLTISCDEGERSVALRNAQGGVAA